MPKKNQNLTAARLRQFPGLENLTDEQANRLVESIKDFALTIYEHHSKSKKL